MSQHLHYAKNIAGSFSLDERLCAIEDQIEQDNKRKLDLQATYEKVTGKGRGRPSFKFDIVKIKSMLAQNTTWEDIADTFGVSVSCISRFAKKNGFYVAISNGTRRKKNLESVKLKALMTQNLTWQEIGDELNVSKNVVVKRAKEFGFIKQTKQYFIDTALLKILVDQGTRWTEIGKALGVSYGTACRRAMELGFIKQDARTKNDTDRLKSLVEQGLSWMEIGRALGVTYVAPLKRAQRLGIVKQHSRRKNRDE